MNIIKIFIVENDVQSIHGKIDDLHFLNTFLFIILNFILEYSED